MGTTKEGEKQSTEMTETQSEQTENEMKRVGHTGTGGEVRSGAVVEAARDAVRARCKKPLEKYGKKKKDKKLEDFGDRQLVWEGGRALTK